MGYIDVDAAIREAKKLQGEKDSVLQRLSIIRTDLRNAVTMKAANAEQTKWIEEQFPLRERTTDPQEQLAKIEAKAEELRRKAQKQPVAKAA